MHGDRGGHPSCLTYSFETVFLDLELMGFVVVLQLLWQLEAQQSSFLGTPHSILELETEVHETTPGL